MWGNQNEIGDPQRPKESGRSEAALDTLRSGGNAGRKRVHLVSQFESRHRANPAENAQPLVRTLKMDWLKNSTKPRATSSADLGC